MEVNTEVTLTVAVSVDACTEIDGEEEGFSAGVTMVGDVVGTGTIPSKIALSSLCGRILC